MNENILFKHKFTKCKVGRCENLEKSFDIEKALANIKAIREDKGLTQKIVSEKLGISESFYCQLEGGKRRMIIEYAVSIAIVLSTSLDEIFLP